MYTLNFYAMGSSCRIVVDGGSADLAAQAHRYLQQLEGRWSRFLPDSEVSALNRNAGDISIVGPETLAGVTSS